MDSTCLRWMSMVWVVACSRIWERTSLADSMAKSVSSISERASEVLVSSDWSTRDSESIALMRLPMAPRRPVTLLAACSARSWAASGFVSKRFGRSARLISTILGSPVSGSVVSTMMEPRAEDLNPARMFEPWKVAEPAI